jgi:tetratricopeptide (TPR) repeat protein
MYDQAQHIYPGDFVLQSIGGNIYNLAGRNEEALVCRMAAVSLRPDDATARIRLQDSLFYVGRLTEAEGAARANVAAYPANAEGHYNLGMVQVQLGDYSGALASVARSLELVDDPTRRADRLCLRYRAGLASKEEVVSALTHEGDSLSLATYMYTLLDDSDPRKRDPAVVLKEFADNPLAADAEWRFVIETVARVRMEDWTGANAAFGEHFTPPAAVLLSPAAFDFLRALIDAHIGRADAARESYARGMAAWKGLTSGNPAAWEHSDVMRWRREAEAALAR